MSRMTPAATTAAAQCALCGLPASPAPRETKAFCCPGCRNVYAILEESGVIASGVDPRETELFRRSLEMGLISAAPAESERTIPVGAPTEERVLQVSGMWCSSCAWLIEHALHKERGVVSAEVFFASDLVKIRYCPQYTPPERLERRIEELGYRAAEYDPSNARSNDEFRDLLLRFGVAGFLWLNVMTLNVAIYVGYLEAIPPAFRRFLPFVLMGLSAPAVFYSAWPILRLAWQGVRQRVIRMETLLAAGILAAWFYSAVEAFRGGPHIYFDTACAIVTLVLLGKRIEWAAKEKTTRALTMIHQAMPKKARLLADSRERFVSIDALNPGDLFLVKAGERVPADGVVVEGESHVDESLLTGESAPVEKRPGSAVVGGSVNAEGVLTVRANRTGADSTLAQIVRIVEHALSTRPPIERLVDRVSRWFVPAVVALSVLTFGGAAAMGVAAADALMRAITVLVIACPCALGIATPLAITAAVGAASRRGILVGDASALETSGRIDLLVFDKTGTITEGDYALLEAAGPRLDWIASLEAYSEHPLGKAVVKHARREGLALAPASEVEIRKGAGIAGVVGGKRVFIGNRALAPQLPPELEAFAARWEEQGATVAFYGWDGSARGALAFGDRVKPGTAEAVSDLRRRGIRTAIVSGDSRRTTEWVAARLGVDEAHSETSPEGKAALIAEAQRQGRVVAMVGDGINDAPALAQADLAIAMSSGADLAMRAADLVLTRQDPRAVLEALNLSKRAIRVVRQNLFWAFVYNVAAISAAVTGMLHPIIAAGAMVASSLSVIGNSLRLRR